MTYAGNLFSLVDIETSNRYQFYRADICSRSALESIFNTEQPDVVMHLAAESHIDRSIDDPTDFIKTNMVGTFTLLEVARNY